MPQLDFFLPWSFSAQTSHFTWRAVEVLPYRTCCRRSRVSCQPFEGSPRSPWYSTVSIGAVRIEIRKRIASECSDADMKAWTTRCILRNRTDKVPEGEIDFHYRFFRAQVSHDSNPLSRRIAIDGVMITSDVLQLLLFGTSPSFIRHEGLRNMGEISFHPWNKFCRRRFGNGYTVPRLYDVNDIASTPSRGRHHSWGSRYFWLSIPMGEVDN